MKWKQKRFMGERRFTSSEGVEVHLNYYLTEKENFSPEGEILYGIRVEKGTAEKMEEAEQTPPLSASREEAQELIARLMDGLVTPVSLLYMVDDLMGRGV